MSGYYKRDWNESRGDEYNHWGTSVWYFELDDAGYPVRQIELYQNGTIRKYDRSAPFDSFGMLGDQALDPEEFKPYQITPVEFERAWLLAPAVVGAEP